MTEAGSEPGVVVVGAGHAAVQTIDTLRREGYAGSLTLIGAEPLLPYNRPPLSKRYLTGDMDVRQLWLRDEAFYSSTRTTLRLGVAVTAIDRARRSLQLSDGSVVSYQYLVLATGSRVRPLPVKGATLTGVHYLRTVADVDGLRLDLARAKRLVIVGAGYVGLEAAASARKLGLEVTVLETAARPLNRVVAPLIADFYAARHAREGVEIHCNTPVTDIVGDEFGRVRAVTCGAREYPADAVIIGIGVLPETTLAEAAGLECSNGVRVDATCRSSDPSVFAVGDCTCHPSLRYGRDVRLESVDNAVEQARVAAMTICGKTVQYDHVPWFWSDQYDLKLQIAGLSAGYDRTVLRGDPASSRLAFFYFRDGELLAVDAINSPKEFMAGKRWIAARHRPDTLRLADLSIDLKNL